MVSKRKAKTVEQRQHRGQWMNPFLDWSNWLIRPSLTDFLPLPWKRPSASWPVFFRLIRQWSFRRSLPDYRPQSEILVKALREPSKRQSTVWDSKSGRWLFFPDYRFTRPADFKPQDKRKRKSDNPPQEEDDLRFFPTKQFGILERAHNRRNQTGRWYAVPDDSDTILELRYEITRPFEPSQEQFDHYGLRLKRRHIQFARYAFWQRCIADHVNRLKRSRKTLVYSGCFDKSSRWHDDKTAVYKSGKERGRLKVWRRGHRLPDLRSTMQPLEDRLSLSSPDRKLLLDVQTALGDRLTTILSDTRPRLTPDGIRLLADTARLKPQTVMSRLKRAKSLVDSVNK